MEGFAYAFGSLACIGILVFGFYVLWRDFTIDRARQEVFARRDAIFDIARDGGLSFESDEYRAVRDWLNGLIRHMHRFSVWRLILLFRRGSARGGVSVLDAIASIEDPEVRAQVQRHVGAASFATAQLIITSSLVALLALQLTLLARRLGLRTISSAARSAEAAVSRRVESERFRREPGWDRAAAH